MSREWTNEFSDSQRASGIKVRNTRIIEVEHEDLQKLLVFGSLFEFDRLGEYHGYWTEEDARKIRDYIDEWLRRVGRADIGEAVDRLGG